MPHIGIRRAVTSGLALSQRDFRLQSAIHWYPDELFRAEQSLGKITIFFAAKQWPSELAPWPCFAEYPIFNSAVMI
jgi:hypothetical protein